MVIILGTKKLKYKQFKNLGLILLFIIALNLFSAFFFKRIDLTAEKRYTLTDYTKEQLKNVNGQIFITVFLDGKDLPLLFKKFKNSTKEILDVFKIYARQNLNYEFIDLTSDKFSDKEKELRFEELYYMGIVPVEDTELKQGQETKTLIFPAAVITYSYYDIQADSMVSRSVGLNLLNNDPNFEQSSPENINNSVQNLEYAFINEIVKISKNKKPQIAFVEGHGELSEIYVAEIQNILSEYYKIMRGKINGIYGILDEFEAIVIAKPTKEFSKEDKFVIDQYIMNGGKVLWLVDGVDISMDSVYSYERAFAMPALPQVLKIDDLLFTYGIRINTDLLQDAYSSTIMLKGTSITGEVRNHWYQWYYFPLLVTLNNHVINRYIDLVRTEFISSIDTVGNNSDVKRTVLLTTTNLTRKIGINIPWQVDFKEINEAPQQNLFNQADLPVAYLLEGEFPSAFKGRIIDNYLQNKSLFKEKSEPTKMIVVSDGDIIKNVVKSDNQTMPMSFDKYSLYNYYGNQQFLLNAINYLCDDEGLMMLRSREFKLRLLDKSVVENQKTLWQFLNLLLPIIVIILIGFVMFFIRKNKYSKK